jgi:hypothetical protein
MSTTIHLIHGLSAAGCLRQALRPKPGELLANEDVLSWGPLVPVSTDEEWMDQRARYWNSIPMGFEAPKDYEPCMSWHLFENASALRDADVIVVWIGLGVAEQLFLAWAVQWLKRIGSQARLDVIQFVTFGSRSTSAWTLGFLNPDMLRQHPPAIELSSQAIAELQSHWAQVTSPSTEGLLSILSGTATQFPHFREAARYLIERFPDHKTGLGRFDHELLKQASLAERRVTRVIGNTLVENIDADLVGDGYLFSRLLKFADTALTHPLLKISGSPLSMRECKVSITEVGEKVLAGIAMPSS